MRAATNIDSINRYAWSDISGWWDFFGTDSVSVDSKKIQGYASSSIGDISLNCFTTRNGNICSTSNYGVCNGPGPHDIDGNCPNGNASGDLTGWGWNDEVGWISFNCDESSHGGPNNCLSSNYSVNIDNGGDFSGFAWNDLEGWVSFNCADLGTCGNSNYKVTTSWSATSSFAHLESAVFDTRVTGGATLNSVIWHGAQPPGTSVDFQVAVSNNSNGPWNYIGPDGTNTTYYGRACPLAGISNPGAGPNKAICINRGPVSNYRYLRYKVRLLSDATQTSTPRIDDIILNWSN